MEILKPIKKQFTRYDEELSPMCDNVEYLDFEKVSTGLSTEICSYGFRYKNKWIKKIDICSYCGEYKWENTEKHILEIIEFLQKEIKEIQELCKEGRNE
jgi:hypothetical protein